MSYAMEQYDAPTQTWLEVASVVQEVVTTTPASESIYDALLTGVVAAVCTQIAVEHQTGDYEATLTVV